MRTTPSVPPQATISPEGESLREAQTLVSCISQLPLKNLENKSDKGEPPFGAMTKNGEPKSGKPKEGKVGLRQVRYGVCLKVGDHLKHIVSLRFPLKSTPKIRALSKAHTHTHM